MLENVNLTKIPVKPFSNSNGNSKRNSRDETAGSDLKPVEGKAQDENTLSTTKSDEEASHLKKYDGNCHCGKFKFSVHLPEFSRVNECGCGVCTLVCFQSYYFAQSGAMCNNSRSGIEYCS